MYRKNTAGQSIGFVAINASTGATMTGTTGFAAYRVLDGGAQAAAGGTVTDKGNGQYSFALSQADTNGNDCSYLFTMTGMVAVEKSIVTTAADPTDGVRFGLTALPNAAANTNGGLPILSSSGSTLAYTISTLTTYTGNTVQTGDAFARVGANGAGLTAIPYTGPTAATIATTVEQQIIDETDTRQVLAAIVAKINATDTNLAGLTISAIAAAVWDELKSGHTVANSFGAYLDTAVSSRSTYAGGPVDSVTGNVGGNVTGSVGSVAGDVAGKVLGGGSGTIAGTGVRAVDSSGNAIAPASTALSTANWTTARAGKLDNLDAAITSRMATFTYTAPDNTGIGTASTAAGNAATSAASAATSAATAASNASTAASAATAANSTATAIATAVGTLTGRVGAFGGTGDQTILGFLIAIMSKTAATPTGLGTFNPATDSVEALRDRGDAAWTTGGGGGGGGGDPFIATLPGAYDPGTVGHLLAQLDAMVETISEDLDGDPVTPYDRFTALALDAFTGNTNVLLSLLIGRINADVGVMLGRMVSMIESQEAGGGAYARFKATALEQSGGEGGNVATPFVAGTVVSLTGRTRLAVIGDDLSTLAGSYINATNPNLMLFTSGNLLGQSFPILTHQVSGSDHIFTIAPVPTGSVVTDSDTVMIL